MNEHADAGTTGPKPLRRLLDLRSTRADLGLPAWVKSPRDLPEIAREFGLSSYGQQALLFRYQEILEDRLYSLPKGTSEEWEWLAEQQFGLDPNGYLCSVWRPLQHNAVYLEQVDAATPLLLWGATATEGKPLYRELGVLGRCEWLSNTTTARRWKGQLLREWLSASGVTHAQVLTACERQLERQLYQDLARHPLDTYEGIGRDMLPVVKSLVSSVVNPTMDSAKHKRLVLAMFSCLSRIAAYQIGALVSWRSQWLRGAKTDPRAIPGASTYGAVLTKLLREHVFGEKVKGHFSGDSKSPGKAAVYRLKLTLPLGDLQRAEVARMLGLELDGEGRPK